MPSGTTVTLRPNETFNGGAWTIEGGPSTVHAATSDNSDATWATAPDGSTPAFTGMTNLDAIPAGARIVSVTVRVKWSGDNSAMGAVATVDNITGKYAWQTSFEVVPTATATKTFAAMTQRPGGGEWTTDAVNSITIRIAGNTPALKFYEVYADVLYNQRPAVTGVTPTGTIATQNPTIGWDYIDADGDPQERWHVRIFTDARVRAAGFDPGSSPAVADSGTAYHTASGATSWTPPQPLSPGVYHAYVRAADAGSGGRYSEWASSTFTVVGDPPAPPALLAVTPDPERGRVEILVRQTDNLLNRQSATGDGVTNEYLRWFNYGNSTSPVAAAGGVAGNAVTASVVATDQWAVTELRPHRVIGGLTHIWAGQVKADASGGTVHLDVMWFTSSMSYIGMDEGGYIGLTTDYQASEGTAVAPENAYWGYLMWRSSGALTAGRDLSWDECGIWFTRTDPFLTDLEARLATAENELVDLEIRVAELEGVPPAISVQPSTAAIDAASYRGGLDSRNLLGVADASFIASLAGTNWVAVGTGDLITTLDPNAYDGYALRYRPVTVGAAHTLRLGKAIPLPDPRADYQFSLRHRATSAGTSPATTLTADPYLIWDDDAGNQVGAPVMLGRQLLVNDAAFGPRVAVTATPPPGATRCHLDAVLTGETHVDDRWCFDQIQVARMPLVPPNLSFGNGPFGSGPFGGTGPYGPVLPWRPASQCDAYPLAEYSLDGGASWAPVRLTERAAYDPATRIARVYDYEAPLGTPVLYRARTAARDYQTDPVSGALIVSAPTTTREVTLTVTGWHVVDPYTQKRIPFEHSASGGPAELGMANPRPVGEFSPVGRRNKLLTSDVEKGGEFSWRITLPDAAAWDAFAAMVSSGRTLLVQAPLNRSWYIHPGAARTTTAVLEGAVDHGAVIEFTGVEQDRPPA